MWWIALLVMLVVAALLVGLGAKSAQKAGRGTENCPDNRVFFAQVHGITHKNADGTSRQDIIRDCEVGEELVLVPEPTNRFDPDAVMICRKNGEQLGYWKGDGRMAHDLANGWTYRVTIEEIYPFAENRRKHGVKLRVEVLTMSRRTEARRQKNAVAA